MNLEKPREVFLHNELRYKNLSPILHRCHGLEDSKKYLNPIFQFPYFPVRDMFLWHVFRPVGDEFGETERGFYS
jgi:hypothetical protein